MERTGIDSSQDDSEENTTGEAVMSSVLDFDAVPAQFILDRLHVMPDSEKPWKRDKPCTFYTTYKKWNVMNRDQKSKTKTYFDSLIPDIRRTIIEDAIKAKGQSDQRKQTQAARSSKDDLARFIHLMAHAELASKWTAAMSPMTHQELDARQQQGDVMYVCVLLRHVSNMLSMQVATHGEISPMNSMHTTVTSTRI